MICDLCGNEYTSSCRHCTLRIKTWGIDGTLKLYELAKLKRDITPEEQLSFVYTYYIGKIIKKREAICVLRTALRLLGYKGKLNRIHLYDDYNHKRNRQITSGYRWRIRKDECELCGGTEELVLHHIVPLSWGGITSQENCITLCKKCHLLVHKKLKSHLNRGLLVKYLEPHKDDINHWAKLSVDLSDIFTKDNKNGNKRE
jgi:5-methylcytosine-specific restriction endonuclease McrA